jgi:hypothetical protein
MLKLPALAKAAAAAAAAGASAAGAFAAEAAAAEAAEYKSSISLITHPPSDGARQHRPNRKDLPGKSMRDGEFASLCTYQRHTVD